MEKKKENIINEKMRKKLHTDRKNPVQKKDKLSVVNEMLPEIDGHKVTLSQWLSFHAYCETSNGHKAAKAGGVTPKTIYQWRTTNWWKMLLRSYVESHQDGFYYKMMKYADKAFKAYVQLLEGTFPDPKAANAAAKMVDSFLRVGKGGTEPILNSKPFIEIHKTNINVELNADKIAMIWTKMDDDERREFGISATIPDKYLSDMEDENEKFGEIEVSQKHLEILERGEVLVDDESNQWEIQQESEAEDDTWE